jgi:hypothetical protein
MLVPTACTLFDHWVNLGVSGLASNMLDVVGAVSKIGEALGGW